MGLDCYAVLPVPGYKTGDEIPPEVYLEDPPEEWFKDVRGSCREGLSTASFMASDFRGRDYHDFIKHITGVSVCQTYIDPETVARMADALEKFAEHLSPDMPEEEIVFVGDMAVTAGEAQQLARFFAVCKKHGLALHANW